MTQKDWQKLMEDYPVSSSCDQPVAPVERRFVPFLPLEEDELEGG